MIVYIHRTSLGDDHLASNASVHRVRMWQHTARFVIPFVHFTIYCDTNGFHYCSTDVIGFATPEEKRRVCDARGHAPPEADSTYHLDDRLA
jgi:hypothetical protein